MAKVVSVSSGYRSLKCLKWFKCEIKARKKSDFEIFGEWNRIAKYIIDRIDFDSTDIRVS